MENDLATFIQKHVSQIEPLEHESSLAWWNLATKGDPRYGKRREELRIALRNIYANRKEYAFLKGQVAVGDSVLERQRKLLLHRYAENQISAETIQEMVKSEVVIEDLYTNFRPSIQGKPFSNNDLKHVLMTSEDSEERREAWEASKEIGQQVEGRVLELVTLRNAAAREAGFSNFYTMQLELQEVDEARLFELLAELDRATAPLWKAYKGTLDHTLAKRFGLEETELEAWHYQDPFFQEAPHQGFDLDCFYKGKKLVPISEKFYREIGLPIEDVLKRSDLFERDKKNQHAFCMCVDRKQDVRILCNLRDNEYWMGTQLHELGHAVYDKYIDPTLPYLLRTPAHISTTEAIAMLFGRMSKNVDFLHDYCGVDKTKCKAIATACKAQNAATLLVFVRWALVMVHFERALYQKQDADFRTLWWDSVEHYQGIKRPQERHQPDWASKLHLACAPVYYHNYVLGEMTASQLLHHLGDVVEQRKETPLHSKAVGEFLRTQLFKLGASYPWEETILLATHEPPNPSYFVQDLAAGLSV